MVANIATCATVDGLIPFVAFFVWVPSSKLLDLSEISSDYLIYFFFLEVFGLITADDAFLFELIKVIGIFLILEFGIDPTVWLNCLLISLLSDDWFPTVNDSSLGAFLDLIEVLPCGIPP